MTAPLPARPGSRPQTHRGLPHRQLDQQPAAGTLGEQVVERALAWPDVTEAPSGISVPGARAFVLPERASGPSAAFITGREFAHLHPAPDHSLHVTLPEPRARDAIRAGWAEFHPLVDTGHLPPTVVMLYAPRDAAELEVVAGLVRESYAFARGKPPTDERQPAASAAAPPRREPMTG